MSVSLEPTSMPTINQFKAWSRELFTRLGLRKRGRPDRGVSLLNRYGIDVVLDVGANAGQYARSLLRAGYGGRIVSFEPLSSARRKLSQHARDIRRWHVVGQALGDFDGRSTIHVAGNSQSSSLLDMLPRHMAAAPNSRYVGSEEVDVRRLDSIFDDYCKPGDRCFLKLDVQGFEQAVLRGARQSLPRCLGVQLEMSLLPLYQGEAMFQEMMDLMTEQGFCLMSLTNGFSDRRSGRLLQVNGVFYRVDLVESQAARSNSA